MPNVVLLITKFESLRQTKVVTFSSEAKLLVYSLVLFTETLFFFNGTDYSMIILLLKFLLAYVRHFIWFSINASLRNIGTLDLNVISGHWLTHLQKFL